MAQSVSARVHGAFDQTAVSKKRKHLEAIGEVAYTISRDCTRSRHHERGQLLALSTSASLTTAEAANVLQQPGSRERRLFQRSHGQKQAATNPPTPKSEQQPDIEAPNAMPKLLSPTLSTSPDPKKRLPHLLIPDLPPSLLKVLATPRASSYSDSAKQRSKSGSVRSILGAINKESNYSIDKSGPQGGDLSGDRVRSDSQHSAPWPSPEPRQRQTIVLKYGKKHQIRVPQFAAGRDDG